MASAKQDYDAVIDLPFSRIAVCVDADGLSALTSVSRSVALKPPISALARQACAELRSYIHDPRHRFSLPVSVRGTPFQRKVWRELLSISAGARTTYGEIAAKIGSSARAVGGACRSNPLPIIVPCHRVVSATGDGGYMGQTGGRAMRIKRWLLQHEARE